MTDWITHSWFLFPMAGLAGYLVGSVSFARIVFGIFGRSGALKRIKRKIPDTDVMLESDTVAATTVSLQLGKGYGCLTALLDMGKVALIVWLFRYFFPGNDAFLLTALFGMIGHVYPVYHNFQGGRGQAPLIGGLLAINWFGVFIGNSAALILGYLTGSVLVMRWGWMLLMIPWFVIFFKDPWYVGYICLANMLFFFAMRRELSLSRRIMRSRKSTQEEVSEFMFMGRGLGRFIDSYGLPALIRKAVRRKS